MSEFQRKLISIHVLRTCVASATSGPSMSPQQACSEREQNWTDAIIEMFPLTNGTEMGVRFLQFNYSCGFSGSAMDYCGSIHTPIIPLGIMEVILLCCLIQISYTPPGHVCSEMRSWRVYSVSKPRI
jgi:hypothetical protein